MKILLFTGFIVLGSFLANSQDTTTLNVIYKFTYTRDLENKENPYKSDMVLSVGKKSSRYCTQKLFNENDPKLIEARRREQARAEGSSSGTTTIVTGGPILNIGKSGALINEEIVKDFAQKKINVEARVALKNYFAVTDLPQLNWQITPSMKNIGGYNCQKATTAYGGRVYEAWFTTQLPFSDGPWKLHGLPGLILEARDTLGEVTFTLVSINKNEDPNETTQSFLHSPYSLTVSAKDLAKAKVAFESDPEGVMSAQAPNARLMIRNVDEPGSKSVVKVKRYNPIER